MTTGSIAPRSLAPVLPPRAAAQTRVKALAADLALAQTPLLRAALEHEMAALTETRLGNASAAMQHYESAAAADPSFRPALFALWRILRERGNDVNDPPLARLLEALVRATPNDVEGASLLVELGVHLEDRLGDASGARLCFEQALARDPSSRAATLMLERVLRAHGDVEEAARIGRERATHTTDAALRSTLLAEAAEAQLRHGEIDEALAALLAAAEPARELSPRRFAMLERTLKVARGAQRFAVAAQVLEEMAELVARATDGSEPPGAADLRAALPAWSEGASAAQYRAWLLREAGRLRLSALQDPTGAAHAYDAAAVVASDDELLLLERLSAYESAGRIDDARAHLARLLELAHSDPARTTLLQFQRAELAARAGDRAEARAALRSALDSDPETPAVLAVLEDALLDDHAFAELCDHLQARAAKTTGAERRALLLRAAQVAADRARNPERALMLYHRLVTEEPEGPYTTPLLREAHAVALRADHTEGRLWAARALLARGLDDAETSALLRDCYEAELARNDVSAAHTTLRIALEHAACETWAPFGAALVGALRGDQALLAIAHAKLGEHQTDVELAAAHACAQARALWRGGDTAGALRCAERALSLSPAHGYALTLIEELLLARGEATDAVHVLREAAASARDAHASELSLLHAGAAAESAGRADLAAQSYEEAIDKNPHALSSLWALRRLGERAREGGMLLSGLEGLARREAALDAPGIANLELGERYDSIGKPELAVEPLTAALDGALPFEASVAALLLPESALDAELRVRSLATLHAHLHDDMRAFVDREQIALALQSSPEDARALLGGLANEHATSASDALSWLLASDDPAARRDALLALARTSADPRARTDLRLHAQRIAQQEPGSPGFDQEELMVAVDNLDESPDALAAAIGLSEALDPGDDPVLRARALDARLAHAPPEQAHGLQVALARALLDADQPVRASQVALSVLRQDPGELSAWETLRVAARRERRFEDVVLACDTLAARCTGEVRAVLLEESAAALEDELARPTDAEERLRAALEADPLRLSAFERLHDLLVARHDLEGLVALLSARVGVAASDDERLDLLYEQARLLRALGEREPALACVAEVLAAEPAHAGALGLMAEIHASQQDWMGAIDALRALAQAGLPETQRRLARLGAADFLERNVNDLPAAYRELAELAHDGLADLAVWKRMAELAQRAQMWNEAVGALEQAALLSRGEARAALERRAGQILAREPRHHEAARKAFGRALSALPIDIDACEAMSQLLEGSERAAFLTSFTATLFGALSREPGQPDLLRALRRVGRLAQDVTVEHVALCTLRTLELATPEETEVYARLDAHVAERPDDELAPEHFDTLGDAKLPEAAWQAARIACKAWLDLRDDSPARHAVSRHERAGKEHPLRKALEAWAKSFGLSVSDIYVGGNDARALQMVKQPGHAQPWIAGRDLPLPFDKRTRFQVAEQCAAMRMQVLPLATLDRAAARDLMHAALLCVSEGTGKESAEARKLREELNRKLSRAQRRDLEQAFAALPDAARACDAVVDAAKLLALRSGLLAACDLRTAFEVVLGQRFDPALIQSSPAAQALLRFWTSNSLLSLRRELGLVA